MLQKIKKNDKVITTKFFSIADSTKDLANLLLQIQRKEAYILFTQENIDTSKDTGKYLENFLKSVVFLQSDIISEHTKKGIMEAKAKGTLTGRPRKPSYMVERAINMYHSNNFTISEITKETGISKSSLYRYLME
ncbi:MULTISPECIES: recombinase family protein [Bacillati]|uniref:recombinase family protein n=1 Tax=Bacillati TaxID=1783272 RepID=UPI001EF083F3|nr:MULTISPECIES: recombinase family protein [Niallia]MDK8643731.1 recombinase family protein [Niallia taxi]MED4041343.1 recombinase family protein [Niallia taxi]MED4056607.1 recombinase family protein [Niallia taxi]MED4122207.1 recombinase family protein [Niallia taxi]UPO91250.1 recombinase family protein [Niallia sp. Man26]